MECEHFRTTKAAENLGDGEETSAHCVSEIAAGCDSHSRE